MRRNRVISIVGLALVCGTAATSLAASGDGQPNPWAKRQQIRSTPANTTAHFGVLRGPRDARDELPPAVATITLPGKSTNQTGENSGLSRRARTVVGDGAVYLVPGNDTLCLFLQTGNGKHAVGRGSCSFMTTALAGRQFRIAAGPDLGLSGHQALVYGVAPDGIDTVSLTAADGVRMEAPVVNNVWQAIVRRGERATVTVGSSNAFAVDVPPMPTQ